jgi:pantetheine-phosphate adenylyltransferase
LDITYDEIVQRWSEPHRHYHNVDHLVDLLVEIQQHFEGFFTGFIINLHDILVMAAIFHDIVYDPKRDDNENRSNDFFLKGGLPQKLKKQRAQKKRQRVFLEVGGIILATKYHNPSSYLEEVFL